MQDFVYFLGRFHVLALHLPIAIILAAVAFDGSARREAHRRLAAASPFLWGAAAISALVTAALGYMHFAEGQFAGPSADAHRAYGTSVAVVAVVLWWLASHPSAVSWSVRAAGGVVLLVLVTLTGHYGGNLTHGTTFLVEYAPAPVRALARVSPAQLDASEPPSAGAAAAVAADPAIVTSLHDAGFLARQVSQTDPRLIVSVASPGQALGPERMAALSSAAPLIVELNLQGSELTDERLAGFERFSELTHLRLSNNRITDRGLTALENLPKLAHLNLYGNPDVGEAGLASLKRMATLRAVYLWQTGASAEAVAALRADRPDLFVQAATSGELNENGAGR